MKLRHVVLFGFVEGASFDTISEIVKRFLALHRAIPDVESLE
jgi:hypothetical protein